MSYVGITISAVSLDPHQENIGMIGSTFFLTNGQSPRFIKNSMSGRTALRDNERSMLSINMLNPTC